MAIEAMTYVWRHSKQSKAKLLLMLALADSANAEDWSCYPSVGYLAAKARLSPDYCSACLQELAAQHEIDIERFGGTATANGFTNRYYVLLDGARKGGESSRPTPKLSGTGSESSRPRGGKDSPPEPLVEPSVEPKKTTEVEESRARARDAEENLPPQSAPESSRPAVYAAYEQNMGLLTPMIAERLKMLVEEYSEAWLEAAIREAVVAGVHKLTYVEAVLKNWKANGFGARPAKTRPATAPAARSNGYAPPVPATTVPGETYAVGKKLSKEEHAALMARIRRENEERSKR